MEAEYYRKEGATFFKARKYEKAFSIWLKNALKRKDALSRTYIAWMYIFGVDGIQDISKGKDILLSSVKMNEPEAKKILDFLNLKEKKRYLDKTRTAWKLAADPIINLYTVDSF